MGCEKHKEFQWFSMDLSMHPRCPTGGLLGALLPEPNAHSENHQFLQGFPRFSRNRKISRSFGRLPQPHFAGNARFPIVSKLPRARKPEFWFFGNLLETALKSLALGMLYVNFRCLSPPYMSWKGVSLHPRYLHLALLPLLHQIV